MTQFDKSTIRINVPARSDLVLVAASELHLDCLRLWKNEQREFFFHQNYISVEQQIEWYNSFRERPYDLLLVTVYRNKVFGCMGIRWLDGYWDVYNVILGDPSLGKQGLMGHCFAALLNFSINIKQAPITLKVLNNNPAVQWYKKHGFIVNESHTGYYSMVYQSL